MSTIAAIATPPGAGGIAVIRISGEGALDALKKVFPKKGEFEPRKMYLGRVYDGDEAVDEALAVYMPKPRSYTGEDVCEIQCHGGELVARRVLECVLNAGAEAAGPGEFTKRAFMNGKIDLSKAEAVMQLIGANSQSALRAGMRQLSGGASSRVNEAVSLIRSALSKIEAGIDFPEEIDEDATAEEVQSVLAETLAALRDMIDERSARLIRSGASVVLTGKPNVGKSSILNALTRSERAIVTEIPGTTRDALSVNMEINGVAVELTDTAGRRDASDTVEKIGVERAESASKQADLRLIVIDGSSALDGDDIKVLSEADENSVILINKRDLPSAVNTDFIKSGYNCPVIGVSAKSGEGMADLRREIAGRLAVNEPDIVTLRHIQAVKAAIEALESAKAALDMGLPLDVCAGDIFTGMNRLCEITGESASEEVINAVFENFCVGK